MPQRRTGGGAPATFLRPGETWPDGALIEQAPAFVEVARRLSQSMMQLAEGRSVAAVARDLGINRGTFYAITAGSAAPDIRTIAAMEQLAGRRLWPDLDEPVETAAGEVRRDGALVIPASVVAAAGLVKGDAVVAQARRGEVVIRHSQAADAPEAP